MTAIATTTDTRTRRREPAYGMYVVLAGLFVTAVVAIMAMFQFDTAADVVTVIAAATGTIGALVGAYFGLRGSSLAQQNERDRKD